MKVLDGEKIREWRETRNIPQWQMAGEIGITPGFLSTVESGKRGVSIETLQKITAMTGITAESLIMPGSENDDDDE